jgi:AcrR family transcriptional regulator
MKIYKTAVLATSRERIRDAAKALFAERGYETASTADICRLAGTSQSQIIKHFENKQGLLEAIFEHAWEQINPAVSLAIENIRAPEDKLRLVTDMLFAFLEKDKDLRTLFLLEGRRIRGNSHVIVLVPGFGEFIKILDGILKEMVVSGQLLPELHPQAVRSTLMGAIEGLLRDQLLSKASRLPASFTDADVRAMFNHLISCCLAK